MDYHKIDLKDVEKIELGPCSDSSSSSNIVTNLLFRTNMPSFTSPLAANPNFLTAQAAAAAAAASANSKFHILRVYYKPTATEPSPSSASQSFAASVESFSPSTANSSGLYFHAFRSSNLRFFNNMVITTKSTDELNEALRGICHTIQSTASFFGFNIPFEEVTKFSK